MRLVVRDKLLGTARVEEHVNPCFQDLLDASTAPRLAHVVDGVIDFELLCWTLWHDAIIPQDRENRQTTQRSRPPHVFIGGYRPIVGVESGGGSNPTIPAFGFDQNLLRLRVLSALSSLW